MTKRFLDCCQPFQIQSWYFNMATAATTAATSEDSNLHYLINCMDLCRLLKVNEKDFSVNVKIGNTFTFAVNHGCGNSEPSKTITQKKYVSPSMKTRNFRRLLAYRAKKKGDGSEQGVRGVSLPAGEGSPQICRGPPPPPPSNCSQFGFGLCQH